MEGQVLEAVSQQLRRALGGEALSPVGGMEPVAQLGDSGTRAPVRLVGSMRWAEDPPADERGLFGSVPEKPAQKPSPST